MSDSAYGMFEVLAGSDTEQEREQRIAANKLAAATYDVRERFGGFLSGARDVNDFNDRVALCKDDMIKVVEPHLFPRTGVMRRICKQLKDEWRKTADDKVMDVDVTYHPSDDLMVPAGDFHAYQDRVDQDGPGKVDANVFLGEGTQHTGDPADTLFVKGKEAVRHFALWCQARGVKPNLDSLERYSSRGLSDTNYFTIAAALQRTSASDWRHEQPEYDLDSHYRGVPDKGRGKVKDDEDVPQSYADEALGRRHAKDDDNDPGHWGPEEWIESEYGDNPPPHAQQAYQNWSRATGNEERRARRTAAPDYLQKADQALSDLLNQRAEEFQTTIAPLQQALQVVQQAEAEQQAANPFNVMPGGSINVMPGAPGGDPAAGGAPAAGGDPMGGGAPMDPSMGGGAPPMDPSMGADPSMGGGMPPADPAMGGDPSAGQMPEDLQRQMMMQSRTRKAGGHPKADARLAGDNVRVADVVKAWEEWNAKKPQSGGLPTGGEVDYDNFAQETGAGNRAIQKLKKHLQTPVLAKREAAKKEAWMGWGASQLGAHRVAGFDWDDYLNGYIAHAPGKFACVCGTEVAVPSGFQRCACGKQWNSYVIGTGGDRHEASAEKYLVREIPTRDGVIVASKTAGTTWESPKGALITNIEDVDHDLVKALHRSEHADDGSFGDLYNSADNKTRRAWQHGYMKEACGDAIDAANLSDEVKEKRTDDQDDSDDKQEKESSFARFVAEAYAAREAAIYKLTEPGELGEGEDDGTATMKQQPEDWAARNADGKFNSTRKRRSL